MIFSCFVKAPPEATEDVTQLFSQAECELIVVCVCVCRCSPAGVRPDPGDRGGDDGDGGGHHLSAEPLPLISTLPPLQTRYDTQETPATGQRKSNTTFTTWTVLTRVSILCPDVVFHTVAYI